MLYVIINTRQKNSQVKISPMRAGGENGENFLLVEISGYTEHCTHVYRRLSISV